MQTGGRVLFLAEQPDALRTNIQRLSLHPRQGSAWEDSNATHFAWFRPDRLGNYLPGTGRFDMPLASLTPKTVMGTRGYREFQNEIWAGLFLGWLRKPAALIQQLPVGRGLLLTTTLPLGAQVGVDPAATTLFHGLVESLTQPA